MAILVAVTPGQSNAPALVLASELAAVLEESVVPVAVIVVPSGVPSPLRDGMDDEDFLALIATDAMKQARDLLGDALLETAPVRARSVRAGLLDTIERYGATHLVLGSALIGTPGRIVVGDSVQAMLHSASVPVHIAPVGYTGSGSGSGSGAAAGAGSGSGAGAGAGARPGDTPIRRVTVAYGPDGGNEGALKFGAHLAEQADSLLRTATFWVRPVGRAPFGGAAYHGELSGQWHEQMEESVRKAILGLQSLGLPTRFIETVFGDGADWATAMDDVEWAPGDVLIVGTRPRSAIRGVFLGSRAAEILHHVRVPVTVLPG